jgi:hypothetical protein
LLQRVPARNGPYGDYGNQWSQEPQVLYALHQSIE